VTPLALAILALYVTQMKFDSKFLWRDYPDNFKPFEAPEWRIF
jgi:hypothetical protein